MHRSTILFVVLVTSVPAFADPGVVKGPVITGVTSSEAWVTWATDSVDIEPMDRLKLWSKPTGAESFADETDNGLEHRVHLSGLAASTAYQRLVTPPAQGCQTAVPGIAAALVVLVALVALRRRAT